MSVSDKILKEIKKKDLEPKPKWYFKLRNWVIWASFAIAIILASFCFAVLVFLILDTNWRIYTRLNRGLACHIFVSLPYLWIIAVLLLLLAGIYDFKNTKKGYKYTWHAITAVILLSVFVFGAALFSFGVGSRINRMAKSIPPYQRIMRGKEDIWSQPERGLLAGEVVEIIDGYKSFRIKSTDKNKWNINGENVTISNSDFFGIGERIRLIGERKDDFNFNAVEIQPWEFNSFLFHRRHEIKNIPPRNIK